MYIAKNPETWAPHQPDDYPEPAPITAYYKALPGPRYFPDSPPYTTYLWSLDLREGESLASGECRTLEEAKQACHDAAERLGLRRVYDGWVSPPDEGYTP